MAVKIPSKLDSMSPTFQKAWYKRNKMPLPPHLTGSVKQASKEVKPSERVKKLQAKSIQAYGATKGTKVGGEHGSGEMKDTIAPLTRDQHSKVQAAERAAKAAAKKAAPAKPKKPLSQSERMAAIAKAVKKAKSKDRFDVPTVNPDDADHDDLRDVHQSLHVRRGYNEEVQLDEVSRMMDKVIKKPSSDDLSADVARFLERGGKVTVYKPQKAKFRAGTALASKHDTTVARAAGGKGIKRSQIGKNLGLARAGLLNKMLTTTKKEKFAAEEVETVEEAVATAQKVMDRANVVAKTNPDPKKRFAASGLAQKAMMRTINPTGVNTGITRGGGNKTYRMITGKVPPYQLTKKTGVSEEVELDEVTKQEAEKMLGGPVQTRTGSEAKGKLPLGFRRARNLARKAMKTGKTVTESTTEVSEVNEMNHGKKLAKMIMAKQSQHPIAQNMGEAIKDAADVGEYDYEGDMAKSQLRSILANAKRLHDMLEDTTNLPEWVQSKITLAEDYILTAANYMEGEMNEEVEQTDEAVRVVDRWHPGVPHDNQKRKDIAATVKKIRKDPDARGGMTGFNRYQDFFGGRNARLGAERTPVGEEVEQIDEISEPYGTKKLRRQMAIDDRMAARAAAHPFVEPEWLTKEKEKQAAQAAEKAKVKKEEVEQVDEKAPPGAKYERMVKHIKKGYAKGGLTPKEKSIAYATAWKAYGKKNEEVEQIDEVGSPLGNDHTWSPLTGSRPKKAQGLTPPKKVSAPKPALAKEEVVTEAEGKVAVTPKEKDLAAHHGDPSRITYGDVIKARLKSAAAKKMGNK